MKSISEKELLKQNSLTLDRLKKFLTPKSIFKPKNKRPEQSLVDLISWVHDEFLENSVQYCSYIHNKFNINGQFIQYCEENGVEVECLLRDSVASWQSDIDCETFIAQGIFKIKYKTLEFYQCSLFHKGNQNEDEVSFFVFVKNSMFNKYIEFRNNYQDWKTQRESLSRDIYVVGGEPISYEDDLSWDDLIIPDELKSEIDTSINGFLNSEKFYKENKIPWKRGLIFWGEPGCGKSLAIKIILSKYNFKPVTVQPGHPQKDQLLEEAFDYAESHGPSLLFLEDLPEFVHGVDNSQFLQLLDGVSSKEGLLIIATANDLSKIPGNIMDRPSRFDRKIMFPLPTKETALKFLKSKFKRTLNKKQYDLLVKEIIKNKFSFAYLKELYITSVHIALSENRKIQNYNDVEKALDYIVRDKGYFNRGFNFNEVKVMDLDSLNF